MLKIITVPNPLLRQKSEKVQKIDKEILDLIDELEQTATKKEGTKGVGLSAIQVGIPKQVFIAWSEKSRKFLAFIDPEIIWKSKRMILGVPRANKLEGCLSVPGIWGLVKRHQVVKVRYQTPTGQIITRRFKGFLGVIVQHEYDHLQGILFTDRVLQQKGKLYELKKDKNGKEYLEEIKLIANC
jgi:peptide deformylase